MAQSFASMVVSLTNGCLMEHPIAHCSKFWNFPSNVAQNSEIFQKNEEIQETKLTKDRENE